MDRNAKRKENALRRSTRYVLEKSERKINRNHAERGNVPRGFDGGYKQRNGLRIYPALGDLPDGK